MSNWNSKTPIISLWAPWANWVALGWKKIETRTHQRFRSLEGKRIGIHVAQRWDGEALNAAENYLAPEQLAATKGFLHVGGAIICTALVQKFCRLRSGDSPDSLIDCQNVERYGLFLERLELIDAIPARGKQGIWYFDGSSLKASGEPKA